MLASRGGDLRLFPFPPNALSLPTASYSQAARRNPTPATSRRFEIAGQQNVAAFGQFWLGTTWHILRSGRAPPCSSCHNSNQERSFGTHDEVSRYSIDFRNKASAAPDSSSILIKLGDFATRRSAAAILAEYGSIGSPDSLRNAGRGQANQSLCVCRSGRPAPHTWLRSRTRESYRPSCRP